MASFLLPKDLCLLNPPQAESHFSNIDNFGNFLISTPRNLKFETFSTSCHIHWVKLSLPPLPRFFSCFLQVFFFLKPPHPFEEKKPPRRQLVATLLTVNLGMSSFLLLSTLFSYLKLIHCKRVCYSYKKLTKYMKEGYL